MPKMPAIHVFGGIHVDHSGRLQTPFHACQSHPAEWSSSIGGVGGNIARHLARFGSRVSMNSRVGSDSDGDAVKEVLKADGVSFLGETLRQTKSASYTAIHDKNGEVIVGLADMAPYQQFDATWAQGLPEPIMDADLWILDTNLQEDGIKELLAMKSNIPIVAVTVSPAKTACLRNCLSSLNGLICNLDEANSLLSANFPDAGEAASALVEHGVDIAAVTDGGNSAAFAHKQAEEILIERRSPESIQKSGELTGAGDAFASAFCLAYWGGFDRPLERAHLSSALALGRTGTCPHISWTEIEENLTR